MPASTLCTSFIFCLRTTRLLKFCPLLIAHSLDSRFSPVLAQRLRLRVFDALPTSAHVFGEMDRLQTLLRWFISPRSRRADYRWEGPLGLRGTCDVFVAWSQKHRTKVAVKRIRAFMLENESFAKVSRHHSPCFCAATHSSTRRLFLRAGSVWQEKFKSGLC